MVHRESVGSYSSVNTTLSSTPDLSYVTPATEVTFKTNRTASIFPRGLIAAAETGDASLALIFGGQGNANSACVDQAAELYSVYQPLLEPLVTAIDALFEKLSTSLPEIEIFYSEREISIRTWLTDPSSRPDKAFIASAAVSFPMIGLLDLMQYCILGKELDKTPAQLRRLFRGITGHSQGIVVAAALARSDCNSWDDFVRVAAWAIELLFWIGWECHAGAPQTPLPHSDVSDSVENGYGVPSHMLLVRGLELSQLEAAVTACNQHLNVGQHLYMALINGPNAYVVAGTPRSLRGLTLRLATIGGQSGADQSRIPFSQRKPIFSCQFLPVSAPFHTPHLSVAATRAKERFAITEVTSRAGRPIIRDLDLAVFHTETGRDMRDSFEETISLAEVLIDAVATKTLDWPKSLQQMSSHDQNSEYEHTSVSHIIVLGSGRLSALVHQNVDGLGIRVIHGTSLQASDADDTIGSKAELFDKALALWKLKPQSWKDTFTPRIRKNFQCFNSDFVNLSSEMVEESTTHYTYTVETRLNHIINAPPVIVAGMTPTTVHPDFVGAIMKAGYHVELAGGGYFNATAMAAAIDTLTAQVPPGRGITINLIYASPVAMGWQIPLLQSLIRRGVPIEGLTIGAGVPSPDVVAGYIQNLGAGQAGAGGLRHISFKPGTAAGIREVIDIARSHPTFPIILQWTGGRGGGHHSTEDFHEPLLETYSEIRRCDNLYLIVGSGFGDGSGMLSYFTGEWSLKFGRPAMPVDGVLMGSRMMVAREAHTSHQAKALILQAPGVEDADWESSYASASDKSTSVLTVISEMGQPIHKLATRGVRLWKELDETIFSLPRPKRKDALLKRKDEIIRRLNADSHRPWFGRNSRGESIDLEDMTYAEVLSRLARLLYINHKQCWIDASYRELFKEFAIRLLERLSSSSAASSTSSNSLRLHFELESPHSLTVKIIAACPEATTQILHPEDVRVFIHLCRARGRKPVNFILDLDDDFEQCFKKDSLWQSENIDAVVDQDAERVCILQSPVSVRYSTRQDQPAGEILDDVIRELGWLIEIQGGEERQSSALRTRASTCSWIEEGVENGMPPSVAAVPGVQINRTQNYFIIRPDIDNLDHEIWLNVLKAHVRSPALSALLSETTVVRAADARSPIQQNCFRQIFAPKRGFSVYVHVSEDTILLFHESDRHTKTSVMVRVSVSRSSPHELAVFASGSTDIKIQLYHHYGEGPGASGEANSTQLTIDWRYDAKTGRLLDIMEREDRDRRVQNFFAQLWLPKNSDEKVQQSSQQGQPIVITPQVYETLAASINQPFGNVSSMPRYQKGSPIPIEAAVIAAWDALINPLVLPELHGDLLRLVHRSINVQLEPGESPLSVGDVLTTKSRVLAVTIEPSGKSIKVEIDVLREGRRAAIVSSEFFIRGHFEDWQDTFRNEDKEFEVHIDSEVDEAVLRDRKWFHLNSNIADSLSLQGMDLVFKLSTQACFKDQSSFSSIKTHGTVVQKTWNGAMKPIGSVLFETSKESSGNPVIDFLERKGKAVRVNNGGFEKVPLTNPGWDGEIERIVTAPSQKQSRLYAAVSGDLNPIHTSPVFAALAEIPGNSTIVQGMHMVAVCRQVVEELCGLSTTPEQRARLRRFSADLVGMVRPEDVVRISIVHEAMIGGRMVLQVTAKLVATGDVVLLAEAEVEQPATAYVFTGQGSQSQGMGMALYEGSPVARALWDKMDRILLNRYGWSIMRIINENPTTLTIHFNGPQGQKVLQNYLAMKTEVRVPKPDGTTTIVQRPLIPSITSDSESYTFHDSRGLVHATQFAQPAIMLLEKATVEDLKSKGLMQENAVFAGHSLGEWGAISAMAPFLEFSKTLSVAFYRGLLMHFSMPRDVRGETGHTMVAVNPMRVGKGFDDQALRVLVDYIQYVSGRLMEIVNFNVEGEQYVAAGEVHNISILTQTLNSLSTTTTSPSHLATFLNASTHTLRSTTPLGQQITNLITTTTSPSLQAKHLTRGRATIPLTAIDIPFHSNILRPGIDTFRRILEERISVEDIRPELMVGKWITNVVGREFDVGKEYFERAEEVTGSVVLRGLVGGIEV